MTPALTSGSQYYKIGDWVTFVWNYTSLQVTPTAVDIVASCSANDQAYTIASNVSFVQTATALWDTSQFTNIQAPLLTNMYTLVIHDADKAVSAIPSAGYLGVFDTYTFGMYIPKQPVPLDEFLCATCSSARSLVRQGSALPFMVAMGMLTALSSGWFIAGVF
jgi:hypothetical protein